MTIVSLKNGTQYGAEHSKVEFSDGTSLYIKDCYLNGQFGSFKAGSEISYDEEEKLRFADACFRAEQTGKRLIARAEQTEVGLSRKLQNRGHDSACVSVVMARFIINDLVNDERYAERWLRFRLKSGRVSGPRQLFFALGNRGLSRESIKKAFDKALDEETEFTLLQRFLVKKHSRAKSGAYSLRGRLRYEGFSSIVINRYFDEANSIF